MRTSALLLAAALLAHSLAARAATFEFLAIAESGDTMPSSANTFTSFGRPSLDHGFVAFRSLGTSASDGVYKIDRAAGGTLERVADTTTAIPSGSGDFAGFAHFVSVDAGRVAFAGQTVVFPTANEDTGVYLDNGATLDRIYDSTVDIDDQFQGAFPHVSGISLEATEIAFGVGIAPFLVAVAEIGGSVSSRFHTGDFVPASSSRSRHRGRRGAARSET